MTSQALAPPPSQRSQVNQAEGWLQRQHREPGAGGVHAHALPGWRTGPKATQKQVILPQ